MCTSRSCGERSGRTYCNGCAWVLWSKREHKYEANVTARRNLVQWKCRVNGNRYKSRKWHFWWWKHDFQKSQSEGDSLRKAWEQVKTNAHGMPVVNGLLFHDVFVDRCECKQLAPPEEKQSEALCLTRNSEWLGHVGECKTLQRIKKFFLLVKYLTWWKMLHSELPQLLGESTRQCYGQSSYYANCQAEHIVPNSKCGLCKSY